MIWKEGKELLSSGGGLRRGRLSLIVTLLVFGVFIPLERGPDWTDSLMVLLLSGWIPLFMVSTVVADSFAGERERNTLETLLASRLSDRAILFGKLLAAMAYGWGFVVASLAVALIAVNATAGADGFQMYSAPIGLGSLGLSLLTSILAAAAGVLVSLRATSVRQAQQTLSLTTLLILFVPVFGIQALPASWQERLAELVATLELLQVVGIVAAVLVVLDVVLMMAAMARFQRTSLILD
jgi:ABC-2 type transport system permease protein